jgi:FOG: PKD repeat
MNRYFLIFIFIILNISLKAQSDNEFWFAVPFATPDHDPNKAAALRITLSNYDDTVVIEQPYGPAAFTPISVSIVAHATYTLTLDNYLYQTSPPATIANTTNTIDGYPTGAVTSTSWDNNNPVSNKALHIYSKHHNKFSVYYEFDQRSSGGGTNNPDIWVLKGSNALGYDFYTPFQTTWTNQNFKYFPAYSSFDIVATTDNTHITITLPAGKAAAGAGHSIAGMTFSVNLNRGQTYSVAPKLVTQNNSAGVSWTTPSRAPADRLAGTYVHADQPIAITTKDDSNVKSTAYDMIGDQLVPLKNTSGQNIVGYKYVVMRGQLTNLSKTQGEAVYITATANNTLVYVCDISGKDSLITPVALSVGQQVTYVIPVSKTAFTVRGTQPIYVFHVSGFVHEMGGAVLPSVDNCTGSLEVSFVRSVGSITPSSICSSSGPNNLFLNIMARKDAVAGFYYQIGNGPIQKFGDASFFTPVGDSTWYVLKDIYKCFSTQIPSGTPVRFWNVNGVFHLGMINGTSTGGGCRYGYFSNYNEVKSSVYTVESQTNLYTKCGLDTVQLQALGGLKNGYLWFPTDYLIDPPTIANPRAVVPSGWTDFYCQIKGACYGIDTLRVTVYSAPKSKASIYTDGLNACDSIISIKNTSENADKYKWSFGDGNSDTTSSPTFTHTYRNLTNNVLSFQLKLIATNMDGCADSLVRNIDVYPNVHAQFTANENEKCSPAKVAFENLSGANAIKYFWDFGDGSYDTTSTSVLSHVYSNLTDSVRFYNMKLISQNRYGCTDTARNILEVYPNVNAHFTYFSESYCSPRKVGFINKSNSSDASFMWDFGDGSSSVLQDSITHYYINTLEVDTVFRSRLIATSKYNCTDTVFENIEVYPEVKAKFSADKVIGCTPLEVSLTNESSGSSKWTRFWDDENYPSVGNPIDSFPTLYSFVNDQDSLIKYFHPKLKVAYLINGLPVCTDSTTLTVAVYPKLSAGFTADKTNGQSPLEVNFTGTNGSDLTAFWNFGDSVTSDLINPNHMFINKTKSDVSYQVWLKVSDPYCGSDSSSIIVNVQPEPISTIHEISNATGVSVYPNPAKDHVYLKYILKETSDVQLEIISPTGLLLSRTIRYNQSEGPYLDCLDLSKFSGNFFFIKIITGDDVVLLKVLKED